MDDQTENQQPDRLRTAPAERFAGQSHRFDLADALKKLRAEAHPVRDGHRQVTIFQRAPVTQILFAFDAGGGMPRHSARGLVTIHVLDGQLMVQADGQDHELNAGQILVLNPDVDHDVHATEATTMLLTVHLQSGK